MMKLSLVEVILRLLPETCFVNYAITKLSHNMFNRKKYILSCLIGSLGAYIVRSLPITYGIHMILNLLIFIAISIVINKYEVVDTIRSIVIIFVVMMMTEGLNMVAINCIYKEKIAQILLDGGVKKVLLGIPSIAIYAATTVGLYCRGRKRGGSRHDSN